MERRALAAFSVIAGLISLVSGLLVLCGIPRAVLGVAVGAINCHRGLDVATMIGLGLSLLGLACAIIGLLR